MKTRIYIITILLLTLFNQLTISQKKNVLFLMADDFNYWTSKNGYYPQAKTPNIDALAEKGVFFKEAHCSSPVCNPSRNSLMSGFRPSTTAIDENGDGFVRDKQGFENIISMNQYFKNNGYFTYGVGKIWHPGKMSTADPEVDPENWSQLNSQSSGCNGGTLYSYDVKAKSLYKWGAKDAEMSTDNCGDYAISTQVANLISNYSSSDNKDKPFFIGCGFFRPHMPWNGPKHFWELFNLEDLDKPKAYRPIDEPGDEIHQEIVANNQWMNAIRAYLATCALADYNVGVVLDALENSDFRNNTIVVFMGDHGWHLGEKGHWGKYSLWDESNHTTLIIYDPSAKGNGQVCSKVVSLQDIYPTLVDLCGLPPKTDIEGRSLSPILQKPDDNTWDHPILMTYRGTNYIKTNHFRFIDDGNDSKLYNTITDPYQWDNLFSNPQYGTVISKLRNQIDSMVNIGTELRSKLLLNNVYSIQPISIPGIVQAEDYDLGANTLTYYDSSTGNSGGVYRAEDHVDIELTTDSEGGYHISDITSEEWLQYSFANVDAGNYAINFRIKNSLGENQNIEIYLNDKLVKQVATGTATQWQDLKVSGFNIDSSTNQRIKIRFTGNGILFNFMLFVRTELDNAISIIDDGSSPVVLNKLVKNHLLSLDLTPFNPLVKAYVMDMNGNIIIKEDLYGEIITDFKLPTNLANGSYIIKVDDEINTKTEKFIICN